MQYNIYLIGGLLAALGLVSLALFYTSMQMQTLLSEAESFKDRAIEATNLLKRQNEQLRYQVEGLMARIQSGSSPSVTQPSLENALPVPMVTIAKGLLSGVVEEKNLVIRSAEEFEELWDEIFSRRPDKPPLPGVDLAKATVLAAFNGERPNICYDIVIKKVETLPVEHAGSEKVVTVIRTEPGEGAVCEEIPTQAYHIVVIPLTLDEISFVEWVEKTD